MVQARRNKWSRTRSADGFGELPTGLIALLVSAIVLVAALAGIWTRLSDSLASFWPANAMVLGMLVRWPGLARWSVWPSAFVAYLVADLVTGSSPRLAIVLTLANMVGVVLGWLVMRSWSLAQRQLAEPTDVLRLLLALMAAAAGATLLGAPAGVVLLDMSASTAVQTWFMAELTAYVAIVPAMLTFPGRARAVPSLRFLRIAVPGLLVLLVIGLAIGAPIALVVVLPLLIWTSLRGEVFVTSVLTLLVMAWYLLALGTGVLSEPTPGLAATAKIALELALTLLALGPLLVAVTVRARESELAHAQNLAVHDPLTGLLNRRGFEAAASQLLAGACVDGQPITVIMLDIDGFKGINDAHGHAAGDAVLAAVDRMLASGVRDSDVIGRIGGEEFVVACAGLDSDDGNGLAERLRSGVGLVAEGAAGISASASAGVAWLAGSTPGTLAELLSLADQRLYVAKESGRDQTVHG